MLKNKRLLIALSLVFVIIETALGILIQTPKSNNYIQYFAIVLACVFFSLFFEKSKSYLFTQIALICTVLADFFLVHLFPMQQQLNGMIFFVGTQIAYFLRIYFDEKNATIRKIHLITRVNVSFVALVATVIVLKESTDALALISIFYYTNLILNIVFAFINFKNEQILAIGLVFFIICDTFVGFACIGPYMTLQKGSIIYNILNSELNIAWLFYVPSQTLLAISLLPNKIKKRV